MEIQKVLASSQNPQEIGMVAKSSILLLVPLVVGLARHFGLDTVDETGLKALVDLLSQVVILGTTVVGLLGQAWGLIRKFIKK